MPVRDSGSRYRALRCRPLLPYLTASRGACRTLWRVAKGMWLGRVSECYFRFLSRFRVALLALFPSAAEGS
jgi:hypothetical protein